MAGRNCEDTTQPTMWEMVSDPCSLLARCMSSWDICVTKVDSSTSAPSTSVCVTWVPIGSQREEASHRRTRKKIRGCPVHHNPLRPMTEAIAARACCARQ